MVSFVTYLWEIIRETCKSFFIFFIIQGLLPVRRASKENQSGATSSGTNSEKLAQEIGS